MTNKSAKILRQIIRKMYDSRVSSLYDDIIEKCGIDPSVTLSSIIDSCGIYDPDICPYDLVGNHFCELSQTNYVDDRDLFIISKQRYDFNSSLYAHESQSVKYDELQKHIFKDMKQILNDILSVHTMAYEDTTTYSPIDHDHSGKYSSVSAKFPSNARHLATFTTYLSDYIVHTGYEEEYPYHATISVDESKKTTYKLYEPIQIQPIDVGTIKFVVKKSVDQNIDINSPTFDGWVYCDGKTYSDVDPKRFAQALELYGTTTPNSFKVPDFHTFFKLNPGTQLTSAYEQKTSQIGLLPHMHKIKSASMTINIGKPTLQTLPIVNKCVSSPGSDCLNGHPWGPDTKSIGNSFDSSVINGNNYTINGFTTTATSQTVSEPKPYHNIIPVMVYIGGVD